jgi:CDP-diacylglycerol--serine O-phosphatidyltransferase
MRKVYILPNLFTAASLFCGMLAIIEVLNAAEDVNVTQACWLIVASAILDVFDGAVARLTRTQSTFGLHFDSLSDLVAFGVAPAVLAYGTSRDADPRLLATVCSLFAVFGALRLARFNVQALKEEKKTFTGLPIPGAALAITSLVWFFEVNPRVPAWLIELGVPYGIIVPVALIVVAFLMVSNLPFFGFKSVSLAKRQPFEILVIVVMVAGMLYMLRAHLGTVLFVGMWTYLLVSLAYGLTHHRPAPAVLAAEGAPVDADSVEPPSGRP